MTFLPFYPHSGALSYFQHRKNLFDAENVWPSKTKLFADLLKNKRFDSINFEREKIIFIRKKKTFFNGINKRNTRAIR